MQVDKSGVPEIRIYIGRRRGVSIDLVAFSWEQGETFNFRFHVEDRSAEV